MPSLLDPETSLDQEDYLEQHITHFRHIVASLQYVQKGVPSFVGVS